MRTENTGNLLLLVDNLSVCFSSSRGTVQALKEVGFSLSRGSILALLGESGSGKSTLARAILGLINPPGKICSGLVNFEGIDLLQLSSREWRVLRGKEISMVFQDPLTSFDPLWTIGDQFLEFIRAHEKIPVRQARRVAVEMMHRARLPEAEKLLKLYPFQLSGGMRQRVMIAMAMALNPKLLIADEPTTALDATVQAEIIEEMRVLQRATGSSIILITHDPGVSAEIADTVLVMYKGRVVEWADVWSIYDRPAHPYTAFLLSIFNDNLCAGKKEISDKTLLLNNRIGTGLNRGHNKGNTSVNLDGGDGCVFCRHCDSTDSYCLHYSPPMIEVEPGHQVACWYPLTGRNSAKPVGEGKVSVGGHRIT